jgi:hypothetical protein
MHKIAFTALTALGAIALPSAAQAQSNKVDAFIGATVGIHDFEFGGSESSPSPPSGSGEGGSPGYGSISGDDNGGIYGVVAGVDIPVGETFFIGAEGNVNIGDGPIDSEYGIAARAGVRVGKTGKVFVRGGYQEVNFDLGESGPSSSIDDTDGDYLLGAGVEFGLGDSPIRLRAAIDTIAFDTTRATVGLLYTF